MSTKTEHSPLTSLWEKSGVCVKIGTVVDGTDGAKAQFDCPPTENCPGGHCTSVADVDPAPQMYPAMQSPHDVQPACEYVPGGHWRHAQLQESSVHSGCTVHLSPHAQLLALPPVTSNQPAGHPWNSASDGIARTRTAIAITWEQSTRRSPHSWIK